MGKGWRRDGRGGERERETGLITVMNSFSVTDVG